MKHRKINKKKTREKEMECLRVPYVFKLSTCQRYRIARARVCVCMYVCMYLCTYVCIYICMYVLRICMKVCFYV
jgi:hypothetical protein